MQRNLFLILAVLVTIVTTTLLLDQRTSPTPSPLSSYPEVTNVRLQSAPNFSFSALGSSDERHLSDYKGKTVLLNFWASWCAPCIIEFPKLEELARTYPDTLVILALSADTEETDIHRFLKKYKHNEQKNFFVAHDKNKAISQDIFQTIRLPETIIIDPSGNMVRKVAGDTDWTGTDMKSYLSSLATPKSIP